MQNMQTMTLDREARLTLTQEASLDYEPLKRFDKMTLDDEVALTLEREAEARYTAAPHGVYFVNNMEDYDSVIFVMNAEDYS